MVNTGWNQRQIAIAIWPKAQAMKHSGGHEVTWVTITFQFGSKLGDAPDGYGP